MGAELVVDGGCNFAGGVVICSPSGATYRCIVRCPVCKRRTRHIVRMAVWYGDDVTCLACGNEWSDGYRRTTKAQAKRGVTLARSKWATAGTRKAAFAWLWSEMNEYAAMP